MNLAPFVHLRRERFGGVLFDTLREKVFVVNETGLRILELLTRKEDIPETLCREFDITKEKASLEVDRFISLLKENGLIENGG